MKLKYYLRGLGTGIAVTALIIGISTIASRKDVMTDEEVIARAKELGMVERTVLSETVTETEESEEEESEPEPETEEPEPEEIKEEEPESEAVEPEEPVAEESGEKEMTESESVEVETEESEPVEIQPEEIETQENILTESETPIKEQEAENVSDAKFGMPDEAGTIPIQIARGDSSVSVSKRLEDAGLIDSALDYDRYLCQNGYDKKIQTGNYEIPANATQEEIALIITSR